MLSEYIILDVVQTGVRHGKNILADVELARATDFGRNDIQFHSRTHLGNLFRPGDIALGYDVANGNYNDSDTKALKGRELPEVVLVRKVFNRKGGRQWKLKHLDIEKDYNEEKRRSAQADKDRDEELFKQALEEDPELRSNVLLYKDENAKPRDDMEDDDEEDPTFPDVGVEELLEDLKITDEPEQETYGDSEDEEMSTE